MSRHPLVIALDQLDDRPSAEFSAAMFAQLFDELVHPGESSDVSIADSELVWTEVDLRGPAGRAGAFEPRKKRKRILLATACRNHGGSHTRCSSTARAPHCSDLERHRSRSGNRRVGAPDANRPR